MKTNLKCLLIGAVILLCVVLTGCSGRASTDYSDADFDKEEADYSDADFDKEEADYSDADFDMEEADYSDSTYDSSNYDKEVKDTVSNIVSNTVSGVAGGYFNHLIEDITEGTIRNTMYPYKAHTRWRKHKKTATDQLAIKDVTAQCFRIEINMGSINVRYGKSDNATVDVKYTASGKDKGVLADILQKADVAYSMKEDVLQISIVKKNTKENIWNWLQGKYPNYNLCAELMVTLPERVNKFDIDNSMGIITLNAVKGMFDVSNTLGEINLNKITFVGESKIKTGMGEITCSLSKDIKESSEVSLDNSLGTISIDTNSLPYTKEKHHGYSSKYFKGSDQKSIKINKLCKMNVYVDQGEITVE